MSRILLILVLLLSLTSCTALFFDPQQAFEQLAAAETSEAEAAAFREIWNRAMNSVSTLTKRMQKRSRSPALISQLGCMRSTCE